MLLTSCVEIGVLTHNPYDVYDRLDRNGLYHNANFSWEAGLVRHAARYFATIGEKPSNVRLISLGCSLAHGVAAFARAGFDAYGVDVSHASIDQAVKLGRAGFCRTPPCLQQTTLTSLPFESGWFRAGVSADVLEHLVEGDVEAAVHEISYAARHCSTPLKTASVTT